jgi:SSS family solute:Na+ symporter
MGIVGGDGIHLHSWSSIFIQDVVMPLRKKPLSPKQHIRLLRLAIIGVAIWAFIFGALFPQIKYVMLWWGVTEAIFVSGAGIAIIGGLYWARGTTAGAWAGMCVGSLLASIGIGIELFVERVPREVLPWLHQLLIDLKLERILANGNSEFFLNGIWVAFIATMSAIGVYALVSWLTCRQSHNMDKLLHRGAYAVAEDVDPVVAPKRSLLYRIVMLGIDEQYTRTDRWITVGITIWSMFWFVVFCVASIAYLIHPWSDEIWADYWIWTFIFLPLAIGIGTTVWFTWGCWHDLVIFFRRLKAEKIDIQDDGSVSSKEDEKSVSVG